MTDMFILIRHFYVTMERFIADFLEFCYKSESRNFWDCDTEETTIYIKIWLMVIKDNELLNISDQVILLLIEIKGLIHPKNLSGSC